MFLNYQYKYSIPYVTNTIRGLIRVGVANWTRTLYIMETSTHRVWIFYDSFNWLNEWIKLSNSLLDYKCPYKICNNQCLRTNNPLQPILSPSFTLTVNLVILNLYTSWVTIKPNLLINLFIIITGFPVLFYVITQHTLYYSCTSVSNDPNWLKGPFTRHHFKLKTF